MSAHKIRKIRLYYDTSVDGWEQWLQRFEDGLDELMDNLCPDGDAPDHVCPFDFMSSTTVDLDEEAE